MRHLLRAHSVWSAVGFDLLAGVSVVAALVVLDLSAALKTTLIVLAVLLTAYRLAVDISLLTERRQRSFNANDNAGIQTYMRDWLASTGQVVVFSRDLSWGNTGSTAHERLFMKARADELTLIMPREVPLAQELKDAGARLIIYPGLQFSPLSRFTIVEYGHDGAEVAVGRRVRGKHVIEQFSNGEHPAYALAEDLVKVIKAHSACLAEVRRNG